MMHVLGMTVAFTLCVSMSAFAQSDGSLACSRFLLLDNRIVKDTQNARLAVGTVSKHEDNPLFDEDKHWEVRFDNLYGNVIYDEEAERYKCWYSPFIVDRPAKGMTLEQRHQRYNPGKGREMGVCYATSKDGLNWDKPNLGLQRYRGTRGFEKLVGSKENNIVWRGPHGAGIFRDLREPDPARRYKMIFQGMAVSFSTDGLHWDNPTECQGVDVAGDTHNNAFWAPTLGKYVGITRTWGDMGREVARIESKDFVSWTPARVVMKGLDKDHQTYAMPTFYYSGVYLGLLAIHEQSSDRVWTELAWSPDTKEWHRIDPGTPLIPCAEEKLAYDYGCVYACATPIFMDDEIRLYYGGSDWLHTSWRNGSFCMATLRPDGFAGYEPVAKEQSAIITTSLIPYCGQSIQICADVAEGGFVNVSLVDDAGNELTTARPITETVTDGRLELTKELDEKRIQLRFELDNAKLYSFSLEGNTGKPPERVELTSNAIFDGKTLDGWHAVPEQSGTDWTVRDGAIVGHGSADRLSYLVWKDADLTDFELALRYRLPGNGNTGVEVRSQPDLTGKRPFEGYHADLGHVGIGPHILGAWDFHFAKRREYPCKRGTRLVIDENGKPHFSAIPGAFTVEDVRQHQWNDVLIIVRGNHFQFFINGKLTSEFSDNATRGRLDRGAIGLQIHDKGMQVEFKDIRLKLLETFPKPDLQVTKAAFEPPLPIIDISGETDRHVVVAAGTEDVYQGHPHTVLLPDGKTMYCVWTQDHGPGVPFMKRSDDAGLTWSEYLPLPEDWMPLGNCPTINRIVAQDGTARLLLMDSCDPNTGSGPFGQSVSEDNGKTWTSMQYNGLTGICAPISYVPVEAGNKHLMWTHRGAEDKDRSPLTVWQAESTDGGLTWNNFHRVCELPGRDPCEPIVIRSPDAKQLLMLMRENTHQSNSFMMVSNDEGRTWSEPRETSWGLTGDRHNVKYAPDGRLVVVFRDVAQPCPPRGHFVGWVGRYEDIIEGREGQYRIKLMHHYGRAGDCGYAGLELLTDETFVATTYIQYKPGPEKHSVVSVRFKLDEIDEKCFGVSTKR